MKPEAPQPVKLFLGILYSIPDLLPKAAHLITEKFGHIDYKSPEFEFTVSEYYKTEMGWPIFRRFFSMENLIDPGELPAIKISTNGIEDKLAPGGQRKINLDPGYLDYNKVVLASAKYNSQKIYLGLGIYADPTLWYEKGEFKPYSSAFPDFKSDLYNKTFLHIRSLYKIRKSEK